MSMFHYESEDIANICQGSHSSDTLYVAECKKSIIDGVKGSYPQLCEYEKEWLMYGKVHYEGGSPSNLEYQSVTVNPCGSVENAIPFHYKRAILKGKTDENLQSVKMPVLTTTGKNLFDGELEKGGLSTGNGLPVNDQPDRQRSKNYTKVKSSTIYTVHNNYSSTIGIREYDENYKLVKWSTLNQTTTFTTSNNSKYLKFIVINTNDDILVQLEQSEVPTSYEPFKSNILTVNEDVTLRSNGNVYDELDLLTGKLTQRIDEDGSVLTQEVVKTVALSHQIKPYEGVNHYQTSSQTLPPDAELSVPVVSTGAQTLNDILTSE